MPTTAHEATMLDIANAIREKSGVPGLIYVRDYSTRIKLIPRPDDVGKMVRYPNFLTSAEEATNRVIRCDGFPAFEEPSLAIYNKFRREEWQLSDYPPSGPQFPLRAYTTHCLVGDKLFIGSNAVVDNLIVIDTKTGKFVQITGLPSRMYSGFIVVGTKVYCYPTGGSTNINTIVRFQTSGALSTLQTSWTQIALTPTTNRNYTRAAVLGQRIFFTWTSGTAATDLPFIDTSNDTAGSVTVLPSRFHGTLTVANNKLFIGATVAATDISVIVAAGSAPAYSGTLTVSSITGLPSRIYHDTGFAGNTWFLAGNFLYVGNTTAADSILRIQHTVAANTTTEVKLAGSVALPSRVYNRWVLIGTKVYVGSDTAGTSILVITNATGACAEIDLGSSRAYRRLLLAGTKLYLGHAGSFSTMMVVNTTNDTFSEITGLNSTLLSQGTQDGSFGGKLILGGTNIYVISDASNSTSMLVINTLNDTRRATLTGISPANYWNLPCEVPPSRANPEGGLYLGNVSLATSLVEIDYQTVNEAPSDASVPVRMMTGLPNRPNQYFTFANGKLYMTGQINSDVFTRINVLTKSVLPSHALPIYIKY